MNKLTIIGNLTRDPESRTTTTGSTVCSFTVAVNRRRSSQNANQPEADFFRVSAWNQLGEICQKYLAKGRKACVVGRVSASVFQGKDGASRASLDVMAEDVEFLSSRSDDAAGYAPSASPSTQPVAAAPAAETGFQEVDDEDLPF
ncbi:MAG: single-stranded DNA-binding protein [Eubacteriales bacterium]|nr:single-stranded DNA-binding protein [Eubacteriales bacterium]